MYSLNLIFHILFLFLNTYYLNNFVKTKDKITNILVLKNVQIVVILSVFTIVFVFCFYALAVS